MRTQTRANQKLLVVASAIFTMAIVTMAIFTMAIVTMAMVLSACGAAARGTQTGGTPADFSLQDINGKRVHLSDFLGDKVILVNFWATWCGPCAGELPHLQRIYQEHRDEGLVVLAVSMDGPDSIAAVAPFARRHKLQFPVLLDQETTVVGMLNPKRAAPFNLLIGRDGTIVSTKEGFSAGDEIALETEIVQELSRSGSGG